MRSSAVVAGAAAFAPLLAACESAEDAKKLAWLNWQDYIDEETIPEFENSSGIQVSYQTYESNDELEDLLRQAGRPRRGGRNPITYDLIVPSDNFIVRFSRLELISELNLDNIEGLENLRSDFREAGFRQQVLDSVGHRNNRYRIRQDRVSRASRLRRLPERRTCRSHDDPQRDPGCFWACTLLRGPRSQYDFIGRHQRGCRTIDSNEGRHPGLRLGRLSRRSHER